MSVTTIELRERVAKELRVKRADMDLDEADAAEIDARIGEVTDYLRELGLIWWADNAIPNPAVMPMVLMVSAWAARGVGKAGQGYEEGFMGGKSQLAALKPSAYISNSYVEFF